MAAFESKPYDGRHPLEDPGNDWRGAAGVPGVIERLVSYGNWAGPGNRAVTENRAYVEQKRKADPSYDECSDPALLSNPEYLPIDGIDAAAKKHDSGYSHHLGANNMFGWEGMRNVREDDRALVANTHAEMEDHGGNYSEGARKYSEGLQGFFGSRVMGMDAIDWMGDKAGEAWQGVGSFVDGAKGWGSLGEAGQGFGHGILGAGRWMADTAGEAWNGVSHAASTVGGLGWPGMLGAVGGFGDAAVAGIGHVAGKAWDGIKSVGHGIAGGASHVYNWMT